MKRGGGQITCNARYVHLPGTVYCLPSNVDTNWPSIWHLIGQFSEQRHFPPSHKLETGLMKRFKSFQFIIHKKILININPFIWVLTMSDTWCYVSVQVLPANTQVQFDTFTQWKPSKWSLSTLPTHMFRTALKCGKQTNNNKNKTHQWFITWGNSGKAHPLGRRRN